jgi:hypothetical protein
MFRRSESAIFSLGKDGNLAFSPNKSSKGVVAIVEW